METKKRQISMRMTQEEFDSIKDRITYEIRDFKDLDTYPYVVNNFLDRKIVTNSSHLNKENHEVFNGDIFLEACGVEVEKVWKGSELQYKYIDSDWIDVRFDVVYRLKPQPNYEKEIEALQEKAKLNGMKAVVTFEKI
jgi:hypothetical protein